nr:hypothetical protein [Glaciibacter superstes]
MGLVLIEREPSRGQPLTQLIPDLLGPLPGVTHDDEVDGVSNQHWGSRRHVRSVRIATQVTDSGSFFHSV